MERGQESGIGEGKMSGIGEGKMSGIGAEFHKKRILRKYFLVLGFQGASRISSISIVNIFFLNALKNQKKLANFLQKNRGFSKFYKDLIMMEAKF